MESSSHGDCGESGCPGEGRVRSPGCFLPDLRFRAFCMARLSFNVSVFVGLEELELRQRGRMLVAPHFGEGRATRLETSHHPDG